MNSKPCPGTRTVLLCTEKPVSRWKHSPGGRDARTSRPARDRPGPLPHARAGAAAGRRRASATIQGADFAADRVAFENVRFLGNQDTLYLDSPSATTPGRVYVHDSYVEGDVDFIFGRATAVLDAATINALPRASEPSGYVLAPSTTTGGRAPW